MPRLDTYPLRDALDVHEVLGINKDPLEGEIGETITMTISSIKDSMLANPIEVAAHDIDGTIPQAVNLTYGTSATPPDANLVPFGTIYLQYIP